ncbi:shikimate dehydrogenase [Planktotalea sp.]|uniref:shikimate dehydrogenase n=1 Tax=Planktotalea sp. TaxID=2029877 RepID=UPI003296DEC7
MSALKIPLAGVTGHPIAHSKSPQLHGHWLKAYAIKGHYIPIDIAPDDLERSIRLLPTIGFVGLNVTLPHKEVVIDLADEVTDRARAIGAANTLTFGSDGSIQADNTDGYGFVHNLKQNAPDWAPTTGPALVIGAGGAARAVIVSLIDLGVPEIRLSNRTPKRAEQLRAEFGETVKIVDWSEAGDAIEGTKTVVNTTALGMVGKPEMTIPLDALSAGMVVNDLVYTPLQTPFLKAASAVGATAVDGLGMLLHQGVPGFERWFGTRPEVTDELRAAVLK